MGEEFTLRHARDRTVSHCETVRSRTWCPVVEDCPYLLIHRFVLIRMRLEHELPRQFRQALRRKHLRKVLVPVPRVHEIRGWRLSPLRCTNSSVLPDRYPEHVPVRFRRDDPVDELPALFL